MKTDRVLLRDGKIVKRDDQSEEVFESLYYQPCFFCLSNLIGSKVFKAFFQSAAVRGLIEIVFSSGHGLSPAPWGVCLYIHYAII
jgi:hypothetical protein